VREVKAVELEVKNVKKRDIKLTEIQEEIKKDIKGFKYGGVNV
jgi:hypothetical protein